MAYDTLWSHFLKNNLVVFRRNLIEVEQNFFRYIDPGIAFELDIVRVIWGCLPCFVVQCSFWIRSSLHFLDLKLGAFADGGESRAQPIPHLIFGGRLGLCRTGLMAGTSTQTLFKQVSWGSLENDERLCEPTRIISRSNEIQRDVHDREAIQWDVHGCEEIQHNVHGRKEIQHDEHVHEGLEKACRTMTTSSCTWGNLQPTILQLTEDVSWCKRRAS